MMTPGAPPQSGRRDVEVESLKAELAAVYASTSWRITAPLRALSARPHPEPVPESLTEPGTALPLPHPDIELISRSGLFNEEDYEGSAEAASLGISAVEHYILKGEAGGLAPSKAFDAAYYAKRNEDVVKANRGLLTHYIASGRQEGRRARAIADDLHFPVDRLIRGRDTVIVAIHEATRTGAAILSWNLVEELRKQYNVIALLKRGGSIAQAIDTASCGVVLVPEDFEFADTETDALATQFMKHYAPIYMVANSVETRCFVPAFERTGIPTVSLVHEFSSTTRPKGTLNELFRTGSQIVFSAEIVAESALDDYKSLRARSFSVLPQGPSQLPPNRQATATQGAATSNLARIPGDDGSIWVVGIGTITMRKGVEFFISAAASVQRLQPVRAVQFAWIGKCYAFDEPYLAYLNEQIKRAGVGASFTFLPEVDDLDPIYKRADIYFLSSRLDPLPNVTIDSALRGIPTVCFDKASGMAAILSENDGTRDLVVPYLDSEAAARVIVDLVNNPDRLEKVSDTIRTMAQDHFDMTRYVASIDELGRLAASRDERLEADLRCISSNGGFDANFYLGGANSATHTDAAVRHYLRASHITAPRSRPLTGQIVRRPRPGFHPMVYASDNADYDETTGEDPLAHYTRTGFPAGRWQHEVIEPRSGDVSSASSLKVLIHGHFHYPDLLPEFLDCIARNQTGVDLLLTTTSNERMRELEVVLASRNASRSVVKVVVNRGRDIGPFLSLVDQGLSREYDVVGHFHSKRSPHADGAGVIGESWRKFLWGNLVGRTHPMMDMIIEAFAGDQSLGIVFAEDPHLNDWDDNRVIAESLARTMRLHRPLPNHFDFPQGNMFWIKSAALEPLTRLKLSPTDYPEEPVPTDGTVLHALERLLPFAAMEMGFRYATARSKLLLR